MDYEYLIIGIIFIIGGITIIDIYYRLERKAKLRYEELTGFSYKLITGGVFFIILGCDLVPTEILKII